MTRPVFSPALGIAKHCADNSDVRRDKAVKIERIAGLCAGAQKYGIPLGNTMGSRLRCEISKALAAL
jgi:hypothetical protein